MNLRFRYTNHRGEEHEYLVCPVELTRPDAWWSLDADVITRDGDPRSDMGNRRRRTFRLAGMWDIEDVLPVQSSEQSANTPTSAEMNQTRERD